MGKPHGLPVEMDCLVKKGASAPQAESASLSERRKNVTGACACYAVKVAGKRVLLCDVATSGITLSAYTIALKEAGAAAAHGLTVTREI